MQKLMYLHTLVVLPASYLHESFVFDDELIFFPNTRLSINDSSLTKQADPLHRITSCHFWLTPFTFYSYQVTGNTVGYLLINSPSTSNHYFANPILAKSDTIYGQPKVLSMIHSTWFIPYNPLPELFIGYLMQFLSLEVFFAYRFAVNTDYFVVMPRNYRGTRLRTQILSCGQI